MPTQEQAMVAAATAGFHAVNAFRMAHGDPHRGNFHDQSPIVQAGYIEAARAATLGGKSPRDLHAIWLETRASEGWKHGHRYDEELREHPAFLAWDDLPPEQRAKGVVFSMVARVVAASLGIPVAREAARLE